MTLAFWYYDMKNNSCVNATLSNYHYTHTAQLWNYDTYFWYHFAIKTLQAIVATRLLVHTSMINVNYARLTKDINTMNYTLKRDFV